MYYEEQWVDGALCWRTSPTGAWTRYTANELAHRYESAEKRAADAQATVEALQAQVKGYQTKTYCAFCGQTYDIDTGAELIARHIKECPKHPMRDVEQQVEALQRERDALKIGLNALRDAYDELECGL